MQVDEKYMLRCLDLARSGRSSVAPNPMVGAVIVYKGHIIGEGFHRQYGDAHAEVNAIYAVKDQSLLCNSTLYVNLEPCAHQGKTPPCVELIIRKHIPRVVVGCLDPFTEVAGRGVKLLSDAGVEVVTDVLRDEAMFLNRYFITAHTKQRPYIILKWAQSSDGFIDRIRTDASEKPVQLSSAASRRYVHRLRSEVSAIMVGTNTALLDNPSLTVRHWVGQSPVRIFIDRTLRIPQSYHLLDGKVRTLVFTENDTAGGYAEHSLRQLPDCKSGNTGNLPLPPPKGDICAGGKNVEYIPIDFSTEVIPQILNALYQRQINSLLVEGGACLHKRFLDAELWDELQIEITPAKLGDGVKSAVDKPSDIADLHKIIRFNPETFHWEKQSMVSVYFCK